LSATAPVEARVGVLSAAHLGNQALPTGQVLQTANRGPRRRRACSR